MPTCSWSAASSAPSPRRIGDPAPQCRDAAGEDRRQHRILSRAEQREEVCSDVFQGGFVVEDYGGVHPAKLNQALRQAARRAGAALHSHARVLGTERQADGRHRVPTSRGEVVADHVLFTTNGYTDTASPWLHRRVIPVMSYQIATEPLPPALMDRLIPRRRMVTNSRKELTYARPSPDGTQILLGCRPRGVQAEPDALAHRLRARMLRIWRSTGSPMPGAASSA